MVCDILNETLTSNGLAIVRATKYKRMPALIKKDNSENREEARGRIATTIVRDCARLK